ncbi:NADH dehydrogenase [ubiquinone] 1 alpha subcomplex subunit 9, mitochondrial-like [Eriocheir sinensis]|uniref:NADH dehydrogenase [ubiquinone] 1 alpha subcomplex subunit 9, mitochondrial-like n=1 Tax=Eriocheir sinensis TaxID=95602 RepID=UPI0021C5C649|nr:NADH dehydrogenase [ubiquinone] 1 alpha subcomplex subunit 9, mitochondrial-like [Eriocheir sinensis]
MQPARGCVTVPSSALRTMALQKNIIQGYGLGVRAAVVTSGNQRHSSSDVRFLTKPNLAALKKGRGGRSSFSGDVCTVFGASGFIGRYVCNRLGKIGSQIIIPYRGDHYDVLRLKMVGDLGQVLFIPYHLCDEDAIRKAVKHSNIVINLVGRDWETRNFSFDKVHVEGSHRLAHICKEMGVERFLHVSALNSDREHEGYFLKGGSKFLKTKGLGEQAVRDAFPEATIFRPSDVYGQEDRFLRYYSGIWRHQGKLLPLPKGGKDIWKQPVFVSDVAQGIVTAIRDPETAGKTYEAVGPRRYELGELIDWFHRVMRKDKETGYMKYDMKWDPTFQLKARLTEFLPSWPVNTLTRDKVEREAVTDITTGLPTLEDLGVILTKMEDRMDWELKPFRAGSYYDEEVGEFEPPAPPKYIEAR